MSIIINEGKDAPRPDYKPINPEVIKHQFEHQQVISQILSLIATCPMDDELKTILRLKIWGKNPLIFSPMSYAKIAADLKIRIVNVKAWEEDALWNLEQYLKRMDIRSVVDKFVRDGSIKKILEHQKRIIV